MTVSGEAQTLWSTGIDFDRKLWGRVELVDNNGWDCWKWTGGLKDNGYSNVYLGNRRQMSGHRLSYQLMIGDIPDGLDLDHLCRLRSCINPYHLEPVTRRVNTLRSPIGIAASKAAQTECIHGHAFTAENTIRNRNGTRKCRRCHNAIDARRRALRS